RRSNGMPTASNSSRSQPTPTPSSTRPPDSESRSVTTLAVYTGLRCGTRQMPVPSRTRSVTPARNVSALSGSSMPASGPVGNRPSGAYGYDDAYSSNSTTCSGSQIDSKPRSSASRPTARTRSGEAFPLPSGTNNPTSTCPPRSPVLAGATSLRIAAEATGTATVQDHARASNLATGRGGPLRPRRHPLGRRDVRRGRGQPRPRALPARADRLLLPHAGRRLRGRGRRAGDDGPGLALDRPLRRTVVAAVLALPDRQQRLHRHGPQPPAAGSAHGDGAVEPHGRRQARGAAARDRVRPAHRRRARHRRGRRPRLGRRGAG